MGLISPPTIPIIRLACRTLLYAAPVTPLVMTQTLKRRFPVRSTAHGPLPHIDLEA